MLPTQFTKYAKRSIPFSKVRSLFGVNWDIGRVKETIGNISLEPSSIFSGRAINIGYQIARLGCKIDLVTEVGYDFYRGSSANKESYADHLEKVGISTQSYALTLPKNKKAKGFETTFGRFQTDDSLNSGIIKVENRQTASIISISDQGGMDIFFFNDDDNASKVARFRPVPTGLLKELDAIVVSSGDNGFNQAVVNSAFEKGVKVYFDVGFFEPTPEYLRNVTMRSTIVFGNPEEINEVCESLECLPDHPEHVFSVAKPPRLEYIIVVEKQLGKATIFKKNDPKPLVIGPIKYRKIGNSIGVCDAITGGTTALFSQGYPIEISCRGGLIAGGAVWESDKIQEPMVNWQELSNRYEALLGEPLKKQTD